MTSEEKIVGMTKAINQAIKVMGDRFGSTEDDVQRAIQALKISTQAIPTITEANQGTAKMASSAAP